MLIESRVVGVPSDTENEGALLNASEGDILLGKGEETEPTAELALGGEISALRPWELNALIDAGLDDASGVGSAEGSVSVEGLAEGSAEGRFDPAVTV